MDFLYQQIINKEYNEFLEPTELLFLKNNSQEMPIHKIIARKSDFIKTMLKSPLIKCNKIYLEVSNKNLENIHKYFYFNKIEINFKNIIDYFKVAQYLILSDLQNQINNFLNNTSLKLLELIYLDYNYNQGFSFII